MKSECGRHIAGYVQPTDNHQEKFDTNEGTYVHVTAEVRLLEGDKWSNARHDHFIPAK